MGRDRVRGPDALRDGDHCDVAVVGSGAAGLAAALTAACEGLEVVVLEKAPLFGGTTAYSAGGTWIPCNHLAARAGLVDSREAALAYFRYCAGEHFNASVVDAFLDNAPAMLEYFEHGTEVRFSYAVGRPDYRPELPGAAQEGRTIHPLPLDGRRLGEDIHRLRPPLSDMTLMGLMIKPGPELRHFLNVFRSWGSTVFVARKLLRHFRDLATRGRAMDLSNGNALIGRLALSAIQHGARIHTSTEPQELVVQDGRVCGIRFRRDGESGVLHVRRGVVLAGGGFPHDVERRQQLYPHDVTGRQHHSPAPATNTGATQRMAEAAGARFDSALSSPACWAPVSLVPRKDGGFAPFPHLIDRQKPGFVAVTRRGLRFVNEANSYHDFGNGLIQACQDEPQTCAFLIGDHRTVRRYGMGTVKPAPIPLGRHVRSGYLIRADSLRELAQRCGIDADTFEATVREYNRHAEQGHDPAFHRGENGYNRYNGDPDHRPNPCVAPIEHAPFYAVRLVMGELGTFAGLAIDAHARVLDRAGTPIPGLYAAGNDACSIMGGDYMSGGGTLGPGMTFGYIAARHMASRNIAS